MTDAIEVIVDAHKKLGQLDLQNKELVNELLLSARRNVAIQLADVSVEGFKGALDTMDKMKAIEDYIKVKVGQNLAELHTQNMVAAERLRIVRDIGKWLEQYLAHSSVIGKDIQGNPNVTPKEDNQFWLEDLGLTKRQSMDWQRVAKLENKLFEDWLNLFIDTAQTKVDELYLAKLLSYVSKEPEETESKGLSRRDKNRKYYDDLLRQASEGHLSREQFVRETEDWKSDWIYIEKVLHQIGELF